MEFSGKPSLQELARALSALQQDTVRHEQQLAQLLALVLQYAEQAENHNLHEAWHPPVNSLADRFDGFESKAKLRPITKVPNQKVDIVDKLKTTWLGQIYVNRLKQYKVFFWLVNWIWARTYLPFVRFVSIHLNEKRSKKWLPLTKQNAYAKTRGVTPHKLSDASVTVTPTPKVFPETDQSYLQSPHASYHFPEISVIQVTEGMIYGGTNLILTKDEVICHDLYDFVRDSTSEELHGRTQIDPDKNKIRWLLHDDTPEHMPAAAAFVDACAPNYAHWLTEVLPRIAAFCADEEFKHIPIVVNDGLHENILASLFLVSGNSREIIALAVGRAIKADVIYLTSVAGYVPFDRRNPNLAGHSHGLFSPNSLQLVSKNFATLAEKIPEQTWPKKIFLRRNSGARKVTNAAELEDLFVSNGYVIVEPEKLTFYQQMLLFNNANAVVAPTGAALGNAIFCKPGTRIGVLMAKHENMIYRYWSNMLAPFQVDVVYLLGNIAGNNKLGIHADFYVDKACAMNFCDMESVK